MYEHPSFTYRTIVIEQQRIDRENEMRRVIAEHPDQIVPRAHPLLSRLRGWFRAERADAAAAPVAGDRRRVIRDPAERSAHAG